MDRDRSRSLVFVTLLSASVARAAFSVEAPVIAVVEAKNENIMSAKLGQCIAEMVAVQLFNKLHREGNKLNSTYGTVTSGKHWLEISEARR